MRKLFCNIRYKIFSNRTDGPNAFTYHTDNLACLYGFVNT